jgi:bacillithiol biosynthesis deacetylase BshB1
MMDNIKLDILAMAAHPDDAELSCAGTLMVHARLGKKIGIIDLTEGELGTRGTAETRKQEAADAAISMALDIRENLGLPDGFFENRREHQMPIIRAIRKYRPEVILANAPEDRHPDHGRASQLIYDSSFLAGLIKIETELDGEKQEAWRPKQVFYFIQDRYLDPDFIVDISTVMEQKKKAMRCFKTQFMVSENDSLQTYISTPAFFDSVIQRSAMYGKMIGVAFGEGFITPKKVGVRSFEDLIL